MDHVSLNRKLKTFIGDGGYFRGVSPEVLFELLVAWENWPGTSSEFYRSVGFSHRKLAGLLGKAKKLKRGGAFGEGEFKSVQVLEADPPASLGAHGDCGVCELVLKDGRAVKFLQVEYLVEFLKKSA